MLDIKIEPEKDGRVRVALNGRLDTQTYEQCEQRLAPVLAACPKVLILDLVNLAYLSSMGLRVLMKTNKAMSAHQGKLLLTRLQPAIRAVIDIANALPPQSVFASVEEADQYLDTIQRRVKEKGTAAGTL